MRQLCQDKYFCRDILDFNQYQKYDKTPSIIYADLESLIKRVYGCKNNLHNINNPQQKRRTLFHMDISTYGHMMVKKITMMLTAV